MNDPQINFGRTRQYVLDTIAERVAVDIPSTTELGQGDAMGVVFSVQADAVETVATPTGSATVTAGRASISALTAGWSVPRPAVNAGETLWTSLWHYDSDQAATTFTAPRKAGTPIASAGTNGAAVWAFYAAAGSAPATPAAYTADPSGAPDPPAGWAVAQPVLGTGEALYLLLVTVTPARVATPAAPLRLTPLDGDEGAAGAIYRRAYLKTTFLAGAPSLPQDYTYAASYEPPPLWGAVVPSAARNERIWAVDLLDDAAGNVGIISTSAYIIKELDVERTLVMYTIASSVPVIIGGTYDGLTFTPPAGLVSAYPTNVPKGNRVYQIVILLGRSATPTYGSPMRV